MVQPAIASCEQVKDRVDRWHQPTRLAPNERRSRLMRSPLPLALLVIITAPGCGERRPEGNPSNAVSPAPVSAGSPRSQPLPDGDPISIATTAIAEAEHSCGAVIEADRLGDGSIRAVCDNGEEYRVTHLEGVGRVAMKCSAMRRLKIEGC